MKVQVGSTAGAVTTLIALWAGLTTAVAAPVAAAAPLTVTTAADALADDGSCSRREAVEAADTDTASGASVRVPRRFGR